MSEFVKEELLSAYLDGELTAAERERVEKLLADDASARAMLDELRAASEAVRGLPAYKLNEDLGSRVLKIAERRMLSEAPSDVEGDVDARPTPVSFWQTAARRFLTPRAFAWSTTAIIVAVILSIYGPEEERRAAQGPIAMQTEADESAPADERLAEGREKRGPGEFRPAPPASAIAAAEAKSAPAMKAPAMKAPAATPLPNLGSALKKEAAPGMGMGGGGMGIAKEADGRMGMGGMGMKGGLLGSNAKPADGLTAVAASADALQYGAESQLITVRCYYVSSQEDAQKSLQKILLSQKPPIRNLAEVEEREAFDRKRQTVQSKAAPPAETSQLDKPQKAIAKIAPSQQQISIEATPVQLQLVLAELGKQQSVFRNCEIDSVSSEEESRRQEKIQSLTDNTPMRQQAAPQPVQQQQLGNRIAARQSGGAADFYSTLDKKANYRIEFIIEAAQDKK